MSDARTRRLPDGRILAVHRNRGLRKLCGCARSKWAKCPHPWHFSFAWRGKQCRRSLDRHTGRHIDSKTEAESVADRIREEIRNGTFGVAEAAGVEPATALAFDAFGDLWQKGRGKELVNARDNAYRLGRISKFVLPGSVPPITFGQTDARAITTNDIDAFRDFRKAAGLSSTTINHDLRLLRKMFNWGIRSSVLARTPFKIGTEAAISLEREVPRNKRLEGDDDEARLLAAANDHLRALVIAILDTACRPGELLSLQWRDVSLRRREIRVRAEKEKTRRERIIPISSRLMAVLEMRVWTPQGNLLAPTPTCSATK
jgi:Phage integrase family/Arm DNA-binding domain